MGYDKYLELSLVMKEKKGQQSGMTEGQLYKCKYRMNYRGHSTDVMDRAAVNLANL